jgi:hypothetical protein
MSVPGWPTAFRGSHAVAAGLVTPDRLRGPRFLRLLPDVYCRAAAEPPGLLLRSLAAYRLVEDRGVLSGHSAAALLDAECAPRRGTPAEVTLLRGNLRAHPGLVVRRGLLRQDEITHVRDVACTTPLRTAFDLARGADRDAAVMAVDRRTATGPGSSPSWFVPGRDAHQRGFRRAEPRSRASRRRGGVAAGSWGRRVHRLTRGYRAPWPRRPRSCSTSTAR